MRSLSIVFGAVLSVAALSPAAASPPVQAVDPAAAAELIVETKVLSRETRAPKTPVGTEVTELRCVITKIVSDKQDPAIKVAVKVGTQLALIGQCQLNDVPLGANMAGYPSHRCDAGAWSAPYWMKQQEKNQALTLYLKHAVTEPGQQPIRGRLETVAAQQPGPSPAIVSVVPAAAPAKK